MWRCGRIVVIALMAAAIVLTATDDAHAYIDPSTGSYVLQILLAGLLGALFALKMFWRRILSFFTRSSSKDKVVKGDD